jgi:hypothetical protein
MIRLILLLIIVIFILYSVRILLNYKNDKKKYPSNKKMKFCPFCKSYVTVEQSCVKKGFNHSDLE